MDTSTLITKVLIPRRRRDVLTRQRLLDQLYDVVDRKVVLVSAPAGYGKTTLMIDFAHDLEHPICWYTLDESDRDPRIFFEHLILSLNHRFPDFGERTRQVLAATTDLGSGAPGVVNALLNEIVDLIPQWFVLVLDDYHRLEGGTEVEAILNRCLIYQRGQFLLIIASRGAVELPSTITLMARGEMGGIGQEALRFNAGEIQKLIAQNYGLYVPEAEAEALAVQSEGWITGILLTAHTMWKGILDGLVRARSSDLPVYEYLAHEVLTLQELPVQEFLIASSTLREMSPTLCQEALGLEEAEHFLTLLEERNLFVTRLNDEWYRYHHLFQEYLQARLQQDDKSRWIELHRLAADWFDAHEQPEEAVHHHLVVDAYEDAADVMEAAVQDTFYAGRLETLMTWGAALPDSLRERIPRLALFQSRAADMLGRWKESLVLTDIAQRGYQARKDHHGLAYTLLHRCEVWQGQGQFQEALALGQETLSLIEETGVPVHYEAHRILGRAYLSLGQLEDGEIHLRQALSLCLEQGNDYDRSSIQGALADCLWRQGSWAEAAAIQRQSVETRRRIDNSYILAAALNDLGFLLYTIGEYGEALDIFEQALTLARRSGNRLTQAMTLVSLSELTRDLGAFERAVNMCEEGLSISDELSHGFLSTYGREALGLAYRCQGNYPQAQAFIEQAVARAKAQSSEYGIGRYGASLGLVLVEMGKAEAGLEELAQACERLERIGARSELTRARFFTARALFQIGQESEALTTLQHLLDTVDSPSRESLLIVEGQRALSLLKCAYERQADNKELVELIDQVYAFEHTAQAILSRVSSLALGTKTQTQKALRIFGFGHGRAELGGKTIPVSDWGAAATRYMLFYLLTHPSRSRSQIAAVLWPELSSSKVKANFHSTKSRLNRALGQNILRFDGLCYDVHPDLDYWFDVKEFEQLLRETESDRRRTESLQQAIALYQGNFLEDCYADWAVRYRETLQRQYLEAVAELAERLLARRRYRQTVRVLQRGLQVDELREEYHFQLMRAYALSGQRNQALIQYQRCVEILECELHTTPSRATNELHQRILDELPLD